MTMIENALQNLEGYPRWFVALCAIIVGVAAVWVLAKVLRWTLYLAAIAALAVVVVGTLIWWLG